MPEPPGRTPRPLGSGVVLVGLPGSGKSSVGRLIAERLGRRFVDTDAVIEELTGIPASAYLADHGEQRFREAERAAVVAACRHTGAVVAAGGGAVLDPLNRWDLWTHGTVVWLRAAPAALARRLAADPVLRPTYVPYRAERFAEVEAQRAAYYRAADLEADADRPAATAAAQVLHRLTRRLERPPTARRLFDAQVVRHHPVGPATARLVLGTDLDRDAVHAALGPLAEAPASLVADARAAAANPALLDALPVMRCLRLRTGERIKRLRPLERVLEWLAAEQAERGEPLIAFGGGTLGDLAGTAAALYARGVPLIQVPTTWLAQADSAIGGKVAVNLRTAKNAAGAFWPPAAVIADVATLRSLSRRQRRDGMAESVKSALIGDASLWQLIEQRGRAALGSDEAARYAIVERSARLKLAVCDRDPFEAGERRTLNLGHTLGHALEVESRYRLPHGQAVALGLRAVAAISALRGGDPQLGDRLDAVLARLGFRLHRAFDPAAVRTALLRDKKRAAGRQRWILPLAIGDVAEVDDVSASELEVALRTIGPGPTPASER